MTPRGLFLVFEGVEGAGKSTQARLLAAWLSERRIPHRLSREPGGTALGESVRGVLLDARGPGISPEAELLLMLAARAAFVRELVEPALARGEVMISDRFDLSSLAYQGVGRGLGVEEVDRLNRFATGGVAPDLTIVLDVPAAVGRARQASGGKARDRIEAEGAAFHERVGEAYRSLSGRDSRTVLLAASDEPSAVHRSVVGLLATRFPEPFAAAQG
jgi:dTMP kinase